MKNLADVKQVDNNPTTEHPSPMLIKRLALWVQRLAPALSLMEVEIALLVLTMTVLFVLWLRREDSDTIALVRMGPHTTPATGNHLTPGSRRSRLRQQLERRRLGKRPLGMVPEEDEPEADGLRARVAAAVAAKKSASVGSSPLDDNDDDDAAADDGPHPVSGDGEPVEQVPYRLPRYSVNEMRQRSRDFYEMLDTRRTVRRFSSEPIDQEVLDYLLRSAGTSPSGAHTQPWTFAVVTDPELKSAIREIIETEEQINYERRMGKQWVADLKPFKTNHVKPYLEEAPALVLVLKHAYGLNEDGSRFTTYYNEQSICIAVGLLLAAINNVGLATVTSTPLNAGVKLRTLLGRPKNEKVVMLLPIGYPSESCTVPKLQRKSLDDICVKL